jgi:hypothetical protein
MDTKDKKQQLRAPSVSASKSVYAIGKTPLERMYQVSALSRRARLVERMANHERSGRTRRSS